MVRPDATMILRHLLLILSLCSLCLAADPFKVGDTIPAFATKDQHEKAYNYEPGSLRLLLVAYEMGVGKDTNAWLAKQPVELLGKHQAAFLADIHPMPGIGRVFAMPKMRKYPHQIVLGDDEKLLERHPRKKGHLTVFSLDGKGTITEIRHIDPEKDLAKLFGS